MNGTAFVIAVICGILAVAPIGALIAAWSVDAYRDVLMMLYWMGGCSTATNVIVVFSS